MRIRKEKLNCKKCGQNANDRDGIQYINAACELAPVKIKGRGKSDAEDTKWGVHCVLGVGVQGGT